MSFFVAYALTNDEIVDGDEIASTTGWAAFADWAATLPADYYNLRYLAEYGEREPADAIADLESELERALREHPGRPDENVIGVGQHLLAELRSRPEGADAMVVTNGTGGGEEDDDT